MPALADAGAPRERPWRGIMRLGDADGGRSSQVRAPKVRYVGVADWWGRHVWVERDGVRTLLRYRGAESMVSFAWGRLGSGARQLSRSILWDATGCDHLAAELCCELTHELVARLPELGFELTREEVMAWLERKQPREDGAS